MKKILVIEDDHMMRENICELLSLSGYEVESAENGKIGIEKTRNFYPDLILCDIIMPELDGYSVLHLLSKNEETASIPFMFLSAKCDNADRRQGMNLGADDFLSKPFKEIELINAVETRLRKHAVLMEHKLKLDEHSEHEYQDQELTVDFVQKNYEAHEYKAKEFIYQGGQNAYYLYFLAKGKVKTFKINEDGKEFITGFYDEMDFMGYKPILEDRPYDEYCKTLSTCLIYSIPKSEFLTIIHKNPIVTERFVKLISKNLSNKEEELMQMAYSSVRNRVASKILALVDTHPNNYISLSRTDFANMIGIAKETLIRTLTEFKEEGIIETNGSKIILLKPKKLEALLQVI